MAVARAHPQTMPWRRRGLRGLVERSLPVNLRAVTERTTTRGRDVEVAVTAAAGTEREEGRGRAIGGRAAVEGRAPEAVAVETAEAANVMRTTNGAEMKTDANKHKPGRCIAT